MEDIAPDSSSYLPKDSPTLSTIIDCQEYYLLNNNCVYKIIIGKNNTEVFIKNKNYFFSFNQKDLSILIRTQLNTIDEAYDFIINLFDLNKVHILSITLHKEMKLLLNISEEKEIKLTLKYNTINNMNIGINDFIMNELKQLNNEINKLKQENRELKNEINILKKYSHQVNQPKTTHSYNPNFNYNLNTNTNTNINISAKSINSNISNKSNKIIPLNIKFISDLVNNSFGYTDLDYSFIIFKSLYNIQFLVYATFTKSIVVYNITLNKVEKEIDNCHEKYITNFRHTYDIKSSRDLVMSISSEENNIKIWDVKTWNSISNIKSVNYNGWVYSACFYLDLNKNIFVLTSNRNKKGDCEAIKIFDLNGYIIKEIKDSKEQTYFINIYYDESLNKNFIITGNVGFVKSYDVEQNELYHKYIENDEINNFCHFSIVIRNNSNKIEMIESCFDGYLRLWDFHEGYLIKKIKVSNDGLRGISIYNEKYLFVGCDDKKIKLVDIENESVAMNLVGHNNEVITIKKFKHDKYGECIISQNGGQSQIKLWKIG